MARVDDGVVTLTESVQPKCKACICGETGWFLETTDPY